MHWSHTVTPCTAGPFVCEAQLSAMQLTLNSKPERLASLHCTVSSIQDWFVHDIPEAETIGVLPQWVIVQEVPPFANFQCFIEMGSHHDLIEEVDSNLETVCETVAEGVKCTLIPSAVTSTAEEQ